MAEVLEAAQLPTGGRVALGIVLDEIMRGVRLNPVNLSAPQGGGFGWVQAGTFIACNFKG